MNRAPTSWTNFRDFVFFALMLVLLTGCTRTPQPVHSFAEGKPAKLSDWHLVEARDGRLVANIDVVPYDLNTPLFSDYAHKFRTLWMPKGRPRSTTAKVRSIFRSARC